MDLVLTFTVLISFFFATSSSFLHSPGCVVTTANGMLIGTKESTIQNRNTYYAYRGIPFAKPPIGNLRFEPPEPFGKWFKILDTTKEKNICVQLVSTQIHGSEDCLYLNIYTPFSSADAAIEQPLNVVVWIHGGGFYAGNNQYELHDQDVFLEENFVVVAIAYRLGIFGFYSTGDLNAPGNYGLKDQILALRWVKDNIKAFGGDPDKITLFGGGIGGAGSISVLTQTPLTKGLYHRAIMQSGSSLCLWGISNRASEVAYTTAQLLKMKVANRQDLKEKLKSANYRHLLIMSTVAQNMVLGSDPITSSLPLAPVIEPEHPGAVIRRPVYDTMINGDFNLTPLLMGINSKEGKGCILNGFLDSYLKRFELASEKLVPGFFGPQDSISLKEIGDRIKAFYFHDVDATTFKVKQLYAYSSDLHFTIKVMQAAQICANFTDVFFYILSYMGELDPGRQTDSGVNHYDYQHHLFNVQSAVDPFDLETRARIVRMWTNFAKTGNPTPQADSLLQDVIWKKIDKELNYLEIGINLKVGVNPRRKNYRFWMDLLQEYGRKI